jgi:hypothetical protein
MINYKKLSDSAISRAGSKLYTEYPNWYNNGIPLKKFELFTLEEKWVAACGFLDCGAEDSIDKIEENYQRRLSKFIETREETEKFVAMQKKHGHDEMVKFNISRLEQIQTVINFAFACKEILISELLARRHDEREANKGVIGFLKLTLRHILNQF